jgi:hypothetical protein
MMGTVDSKFKYANAQRGMTIKMVVFSVIALKEPLLVYGLARGLSATFNGVWEGTHRQR